MAFYYSTSVGTDAALLSAVRNTLISAGWQTTTNANPYTNTIDYYVYKSPGTSNLSGVDWFVATWADTTNHRVGVMAFEEFNDAATPQYRKFTPAANATPGPDFYHQGVLQSVGAFTGSPGGIVLERATGSTGNAAVLVRATLDMVVAATISTQGTRKGGWVGCLDWASWNTERPDLFLAVNPYSGQPQNGGYPPVMAAALPAGTTAFCHSFARDNIANAVGGSTAFQSYGGYSNIMFDYVAGSSTQFWTYSMRDGWDAGRMNVGDYWVVQWASNASVMPRIKMHGRLRDVVVVPNLLVDIGDLLTLDGVPYRSFGTNTNQYGRGLFVKAT